MCSTSDCANFAFINKAFKCRIQATFFLRRAAMVTTSSRTTGDSSSLGPLLNKIGQKEQWLYSLFCTGISARDNTFDFQLDRMTKLINVKTQHQYSR